MQRGTCALQFRCITSFRPQCESFTFVPLRLNGKQLLHRFPWTIFVFLHRFLSAHNIGRSMMQHLLSTSRKTHLERSKHVYDYYPSKHPSKHCRNKTTNFYSVCCLCNHWSTSFCLRRNPFLTLSFSLHKFGSPRVWMPGVE